MDTATERRSHPRLRLDERLFIQVRTCDADPGLANTTSRCTTRDASEHGLRIRADHPIEPGCVLSLWVKVGSRPGTFLLTGETRWSMPAGDGDGYLVGIEIQSKDQEDSGSWKQMLAAE